MHYVVEVVIPPTDNVEASVAEVMNFFQNEEEGYSRYLWWDWYEIPGRFSGRKLRAKLGSDRISEFYNKLTELKVTVSSVTCGKESLNPPTQISMVDALWREHFPDGGDECLLFEHSIASNLDVCTVADVPENYTASRVVVAGPHWNDSAKLEVRRMLAASFWNGIEWQDTAWNKSVRQTLFDMIREESIGVKRTGISLEWLCVTVDAHD